jgi:hypothetical protein
LNFPDWHEVKKVIEVSDNLYFFESVACIKIGLSRFIFFSDEQLFATAGKKRFISYRLEGYRFFFYYLHCPEN